jgi:MFS family permease
MSTDTTPASNKRWWALGLIAAAQFMVIMDTSIIGVALPKMQDDLGFAPEDLSWVFNAYVVAFGGLLLLGGRLSDLLGARKVFITGWTVLLAGSAVAGAAGNAATELVGRAVQGAGAALIAPSALTLLMVLFAANGKELTKALALYGAAAPAGGTAGVFLGGVITEYASWPWVFYLNIPIALAVVAVAPGVMPSVPGSRGSQDWVGAAWVPMWFFLNLYLQQVLGLSAFPSGSALLPMTVFIMAGMVIVAPRAIATFGPKRVLVTGMGVLAVGLGLLALVRPDGSYAIDVLPASLVAAAGMSLAFIPSLGVALSSARPEEGGLAAGIVNTSYQVGSALGLAAMTAVAAGNGADQLGNVSSLTDGYSASFIGAAVIAAAGAVIAAVTLRLPKPQAAPAEADTEAVAA